MAGALHQAGGSWWFNPDEFARGLVAASVGQTEANSRAWQYGFDKLKEAVAGGTNWSFETRLGATSIPAELVRATEYPRVPERIEVVGGEPATTAREVVDSLRKENATLKKQKRQATDIAAAMLPRMRNMERSGEKATR